MPSSSGLDTQPPLPCLPESLSVGHSATEADQVITSLIAIGTDTRLKQAALIAAIYRTNEAKICDLDIKLIIQ